jgi:molybdenum cofactor cytidylyltransferase
MFSAVVPAAGSATRFGGGKLLALVAGVPILEHVLRSLLAAGIGDVVVVAGPHAAWGTHVPMLEDFRVRVEHNPDPAREMFSSIQIGLRAARHAPIAILPGDMPFVKPQTIRRLLAEASRANALVSPRFEGRRGHPLIVPGDLRDEILAAPDGAKLNEVLKPHASRVVNVDVDDPGTARDVDVAADLARPGAVAGRDGRGTA